MKCESCESLITLHKQGILPDGKFKCICGIIWEVKDGKIK